jgi:hypothetical protein
MPCGCAVSIAAAHRPRQTFGTPQVLTEYLRHYNTARPHRTLGQLAPLQAGAPPPQINLADTGSAANRSSAASPASTESPHDNPSDHENTVLAFRKALAKDAELLVPRHKNAVLRRHADPGTV